MRKISETEIDVWAYELVGSSPCEDCDNYRNCQYRKNEERCEESQVWYNEYLKEYNELKEKYLNS